MDASYRQEFDFFGFPVIESSQPRFEEAPTDVLFINNRSAYAQEAETFLRFMARPEILSLYNGTIGYISPNKKSVQSKDYFINTGAKWLQTSDGNTLFLDRDTTKDFAEPAFKALAEFMRKPDKQVVINELEQARKSAFGDRFNKDTQ